MNETMARALSPKELAQELRYHDDPGVAKLALAVIEGAVDDDEQNIKRRLFDAEDAAHEAETECERLKALLHECFEELPDTASDLRSRVGAEL